MESEQNKAEPVVTETPAWTARKLLRAARSGTLATSTDGQPFTALITPATAADGTVLLLLSALSEHTRHLRADPRCAVMVVGQSEGPNPQTAPRLTITGHARLADQALKPRWLARHPYADLYADFGDFALWQISPGAGLLVAGFARAYRLRASELVPDPEAMAAVAAAENDVMAHCNRYHAPALARLAQAAGRKSADWRMVAIDVDGCDLSDGETVLRRAWPNSIVDADGVRDALMQLLRHARKG